MQIGTPQIYHKLVADTGAPQTNLKCNIDSKTFVKSQCFLNSCEKTLQTYDGQVSQATQGTDEFQIDDFKFNYTFYCMQKGNMVNLLGLSPTSEFIESIYNKSEFHPQNRTFTIYIGDDNGKITVGDEYQEDLGIPFSDQSNYYTVNLTSIKDDDGNYIYQQEKDDEYEFIVDSGATLMNVQPDLYTEFHKSFKKCVTDPRGCPIYIEKFGQDCYEYDWNRFGDVSNFFGVFPTFQFTFNNGFIYSLEPADYMVNWDGDNLYCLPIDDYTRNYEQKYKKISLLGQPFMRYKEFTFDQTNNKIYVKSVKTFIEKVKVGDYQFLYKYIGIAIVLLIGFICYTKYGNMIPQVINREGRFNPYS